MRIHNNGWYVVRVDRPDNVHDSPYMEWCRNYISPNHGRWMYNSYMSEFMFLMEEDALAFILVHGEQS